MMIEPDLSNPIKRKPTWSLFELLILLTTIGSLIILGTLAITFILRSNPSPTDVILKPTLLMSIFLTALEVAAFIGSIYLLALRRRHLGWQTVGLKGTRKVWGLIAGLLALFLVPITGLVAVLVQYVTDAPLENPQLAFIAPEGFSWTAFISLLILVGILGPFAEEVLFRGIIYQSLRQRWGAWVGAILSALFFAFMHGNWAVGAVAFVLGLVMAWIYEVSGSLWPAIIIHVINNSIKILAIYIFLALGIDLNQIISVGHYILAAFRGAW